MENVVLVSAVRTPFVRARSVFKQVPPSTLSGIVLREVCSRVKMNPKDIGEILWGMVSAPAEGSNIAREALFDSGLSPEIPCTTINRYCASSLEAMGIAVARIQSGQISTAIAGGVESISSVRALFSQSATDYFQDFMKMKTLPQKLSHLAKFKPAFLAPMAPGIKEPTTGLTMGQSADLMARAFGVGREEQDEFAVESHKKAHAAWKRGFYGAHVVSVPTPEGKVISQDTDVREDTSVEKLSKLRPVFYKDGTITAGNASPLTDGASAVLLMSESKAKELGLPILGMIRSIQTAGVDIQKEPLLIGPVYAIPKALEKAGIAWDQLDLVEMHEAFSGQVLASIRAIESDQFAHEKLGLNKAIGKVDRSKFNVNGGSVPIGHPFGATGARVAMQAIYELRARKQKYGLISVCAAGGLGTVMVVEASLD